MELVGKITLLFAGWGAIAGCVSGLLPRSLSPEQGALALLAILFFIFYVSYKLAPHVLKFLPDEFPGGRWTGRTAVKKGFWGFFIMWLILWVMVHTIIVS